MEPSHAEASHAEAAHAEPSRAEASHAEPAPSPQPTGRRSRWDSDHTRTPVSSDEGGAGGSASTERADPFSPAPSPQVAADSWRHGESAPVEPAAALAPDARTIARPLDNWSAPAAAAASAPGPVAPTVEQDATQRRPINPFLTRDPALRAKRLARALVSDIVAYHPARHAEGLRDGTLKSLFRDEIKKSYEEYVDQVGRDFAGSTTHFQDALNDVLASGKKLF